MGLLAGPVAAQSTNEPLVQFTGFLGNLVFSADDVRAGLVRVDDDTGQVAVAINDASRESYALFTTTHINQSVSFYVCGQQMQSFTVLERDDDGSAVSDPMQIDRATEMVAALNGLGECPS